MVLNKNFRCRVYVGVGDPVEPIRCLNDGTHWEARKDCPEDHPEDDDCPLRDISWECDGPHRTEEDADA